MGEGSGATGGRNTNNSVDRALDLLQRIARAESPPIVADLQRETGIAKSTLHGLTGSLVQAGFVDRAGDGRLRVGVSAFEVGAACAAHLTVRSLIGPVLDGLVEEWNETCHFGQLDGGDVLYLLMRESTHDVRFAAPAGTRIPAYGTGLGKAMLAQLDQAELNELYPETLDPVTQKTITSRRQLWAELDRFRRLGYAIEEQESTEGASCIGTAVLSEDRLYGLSITVPIQRLESGLLERMWPSLQSAAQDAARRLASLGTYGART